MRLTEEDKRELLELAGSASMRADGQLLRSFAREVPGDPLYFLQRLTDFNALLNHPLKKSRPFIERIMKL